VVAQLEKICEKENRKFEKEALYLIGVKADGAMRDALSIFDRIASSSADGNIYYKDVVENLNVLDYDHYFGLTDACLRSDLPALLLGFDKIVKSGFDPELVVNGLAEHLRELLVSKDPQTVGLLECSDDLKQRYFNQASAASESFILTALDILNTCDIHLARANNKRLYIEIALSKICYLSSIISKPLSEILSGQEKKN
jgi:DNA polymerase III subunit gamma/tau